MKGSIFSLTQNQSEIFNLMFMAPHFNKRNLIYYFPWTANKKVTSKPNKQEEVWFKLYCAFLFPANICTCSKSILMCL